MRYWDGVQWTDQYQTPVPAPIPAAPSARTQPQEDWWQAPSLETNYSQGSSALGAYASFGARAGASIVDSLIVFVASFALGASFGALLYLVYGDVGDETFFVVFDVIAFLIDYVLVFLLYWWYFSTGWSPGRALVGIRIVDGHGGPPGPRRGIGRLLMSFVSAIAIAIGYLAMLWSPTKQTWHDRAAGTFVVRVR